MTTNGFPHRGHAVGWYQVAWSHELGVGEVKALSYFGRELVLWRDESGSVHMLDAICPHLGAHMGYGGTVVGEELQCPFHGWRWGADGANAFVPYGQLTQVKKSARSWPVEEGDGLILVWYHPRGEAPTWQPPQIPELSSEEYYDPNPEGIRCYGGRHTNPCMVMENLVDVAHQRFVHGSRDITEIVDFGGDGPVFRCRHRLVFGQGKDGTWLTPDGEREGRIEIEAWGVGIAIARFPDMDKALHVACVTPIDNETCDLRLTEGVLREEGCERPSGNALRRLDYQWRQTENDLVIWEHQHYEPRPPLVPEEAEPFFVFRQWAAGFFERSQAQNAPLEAPVGAVIPGSRD